jgi:hypothetical protein
MNHILLIFTIIFWGCNSSPEEINKDNKTSQITMVIVKYYIIVSASEEPIVIRDTLVDLKQNVRLHEVLNKGIKIPWDEKSFKFEASVTYDFYFKNHSNEEYHVLYKTEKGTIVEKYSVGSFFKRSLGGIRNHEIETLLNEKIPLIKAESSK